MASYFQLISVVDHHKIDIKTLSQPQIIVGDAQSCNVLIAEIEFKINDSYSLGGMTKESINDQLNELKKGALTTRNIALMERSSKEKQSLKRTLPTGSPKRRMGRVYHLPQCYFGRYRPPIQSLRPGHCGCRLS